MKDNIDNLIRNLILSRRSFLKYTGTVTGLLLANRWLKNPSLSFANSKPRVVSVRDSNATNWDYSTDYHWEHINQSVVNSMVANGVKALTNTANVSEAWSMLIPYQPGDAVVIKVNLNNHNDCVSSNEQKIDSYPETVNAVIDGLISIGVPPDKIWITDPSRAIPDRFINRIENKSVKFYTSKGWLLCGANCYKTDYVDITSSAASIATHPQGEVVRLAQVFVDANHLINIPQLKGHGAGWITLGLKNHYGSATFSGTNQDNERNRLHSHISPNLNPDTEKSLLADISNNPHIKDKTRLIIGDGLFGHPTLNNSSVIKWRIFGDDDPNILFFGIDPIATDSVMCDYIIEEQNTTVIHSSLHHGEALGLGIHDHWDSFETIQYSLIDYIHIDQDNPVVQRLDVDRKVKEFKVGDATEQEVKEIINQYMNQ